MFNTYKNGDYRDNWYLNQVRLQKLYKNYKFHKLSILKT